MVRWVEQSSLEDGDLFGFAFLVKDNDSTEHLFGVTLYML